MYLILFISHEALRWREISSFRLTWSILNCIDKFITFFFFSFNSNTFYYFYYNYYYHHHHHHHYHYYSLKNKSHQCTKDTTKQTLVHRLQKTKKKSILENAITALAESVLRTLRKSALRTYDVKTNAKSDSWIHVTFSP